MIQVLHVIKIMDHGGAETMIMNIYRNINKEKFQFSFLCMEDKIGEYDKEIEKLGGKIYIVPSPDKGRIKNLIEIYKILKKEKIDVVHCHISFYSGFVLFVSYLAKIKIRICHSHTTNDVRKIGFIRKLYNNFARKLIKVFANIKLACGEKAGKYLYKKSKFNIVKNGIDLEKYINVTEKEVADLKQELLINKDEIIIGHVGRFEKVKNQEYFIKLAKKMNQLNLKYKIVLVGGGTQFEIIKNKIEKENLKEKFILTGVRDDVNGFMKMFDVFVMPSLYEGFPLVVVEALAGDNICYLSDTISKETDIVKERVKFFNLNDDIDILINKIQEDLKHKKESNIEEELNKKEFSIKKMTEKISNIYEMN